MEATSRATPITAAVTGAYCAAVGLVLGPWVDGPGSHSTFWLVVTAALVAIPSYFFVFGRTRKQKVGLWVLQPELLKRIGAWLIGCIYVALVASLGLALLPTPT